MKQALIVSLILLFLAACGQEEAVQPAVEDPAAVTEPVVDEIIDADDAVDADATEEIQEVVEESAAEPAADEQEILLAQADMDTPAAAPDWQFREGQHYIRLVPTQPTVGGADKVEVAEFFYYACPHCYNNEPLFRSWAEKKPANVRFVKIPAMWNNGLVLHARMYYTANVLARNGVIEDEAAFHDTVYEEYHRRGNRLGSETAIQNLFARFGVSADEFSSTWNSFEVDQKLRVATDLARRYTIQSTPTVVVNGKFRTGAAEAGSYPKLLEVMDELVARESTR
jgi:thiol:disulfide interchange protein DsbA